MEKNINETESKIYDALAQIFSGLNIEIDAPETSATISVNIDGIDEGEEADAAEKAESALKAIGASDLKWGENGIGRIWIVGSLFD